MWLCVWQLQRLQNEYILIRNTKKKSQQRLDICQFGLILLTERNKVHIHRVLSIISYIWGMNIYNIWDIWNIYFKNAYILNYYGKRYDCRIEWLILLYFSETVEIKQSTNCNTLLFYSNINAVLENTMSYILEMDWLQIYMILDLNTNWEH